MKPITMGVEYESPERNVSWVARSWPSLVFHGKMLSIYWNSNRLAVAGKLDQEKWCRKSQEILRTLESVGVQFKIENLEALRALPGPCVFVANHMSTLETMVMPGIFLPFLPVTFVIKESLTRFPVFGPIMKASDPVKVGRVDPRADLKTVLEGGSARIAMGISVVVFPQTTRMASFEPKQFNSIGIKLARRSGVPVLPIALKTDAWEVGRTVKDFGPILPGRIARFAFGEPITIEGSGREGHQQVIEFIQGKLKEWERS